MGDIDTTDPVTATRQVYDEHAERYAAQYDTWAPAADTTDLVEMVLADQPRGARIADVGSGSGRDLRTLRGRGADAFGVELSPGLARHASKHGIVILADMRELPLPNHTLDGVLAAASLLHLPLPDAHAALREFRRVLKPNGRLVLSVKEGDGELTDGDGRYFQLYRDGQLDTLLTGAGFEVTVRSRDADTRRAGLAWLIRTARPR